VLGLYTGRTYARSAGISVALRLFNAGLPPVASANGVCSQIYLASPRFFWKDDSSLNEFGGIILALGF
jgi:hypothetical protein